MNKVRFAIDERDATRWMETLRARQIVEDAASLLRTASMMLQAVWASGVMENDGYNEDAIREGAEIRDTSRVMADKLEEFCETLTRHLGKMIEWEKGR